MADISGLYPRQSASVSPVAAIARGVMPWNLPRPDIAPSSAAPKMTSGHGQFHSNEESAKIRTRYAGIDLAGIRSLVDNPQSVDKTKAQWLIPSTLPSRTFATQEQDGEFWMLWADLDADPKPISEVNAILRQTIIPDCDFELYSSKSALEERQKARILIPLIKPLSGANWMLCQELLGDKLEAAGIAPDRAAERSAQLCYLPNRGAFYEACSERQGIHLDPLAAWAGDIAEKRQAIKDAEANMLREAHAIAARRATMKLTDSPNTISAFNCAYAVQEILQRANYAQRGDTFRHPHSESGSYSASVKDGRVHSLSSNDLLYTGGGGGGAHDAFGAFTVLWAGGDRDTALKLAGDDWLAVDGESWNKVKQREYMRRTETGDSEDALYAETGSSGQSSTTPPEDEPDPPATPDRHAYPPPFRGVMHDAVQAALAVSTKPQPDLCTLSTLIGMAGSCAGFYGLPSGMRLNLYGCGVAETGEGKDQPRTNATVLVKAAGGKLIGKPASGPGLEDSLTSHCGAIICLDEIAHFFAAINNGKAPPHLIELAGLLLQLFSASRGEYYTRVKAVGQGTTPARTIFHPTVSLLGFATPGKLGEAMGVSNIEDGLLGRFLFAFGSSGVVPRRITAWFELPDSVAAAAAAMREATPPMSLPAMLDNAALDCIPILIDPEAEMRLAELLVKFDYQRQTARSAFAKALLSRSCEKCERVAGVLAVWDSPKAPVITLEHVEWAAQLLFASDAALLHFSEEYMHGGQTQANAQNVLKLIKRAAAGDFKPQNPREQEVIDKGVAPYSMVMRASKLAKRDLDDAVAHLIDLSEVRSGTLLSQHPNGRAETIRVLTIRS